jgi:hypothetical protein
MRYRDLPVYHRTYGYVPAYTGISQNKTLFDEFGPSTWQAFLPMFVTSPNCIRVFS